MIRYRPVGSTQWTVMRAGPETANDFNGTSRTRYFHEPNTTYGGLSGRMIGDDLATVANRHGVQVYDITHLCQLAELSSRKYKANWVTAVADAKNSWGVWQSKVKYVK